jgi:hypothetical protein
MDSVPEDVLRGEVVLLTRTERDIGSALDRSLVLEAMGIAHEMRSTSTGHRDLAVATTNAQAAEAALATWASENTPAPKTASRPEYGRSLAGVVAACAVVGFEVFVGSGVAATWVDAGRADAGRMLRGE